MPELSKKVEQYIEQERLRFEGYSGQKSLTKLVKALGYGGTFEDPLESFFADNGGALEAVVEWISSQNCAEWEEKLDEVIYPEQDEE